MKKVLSLIAIIVVLDQITKFLTKGAYLKIFNFLQINYVENTGALFGMFSGFNMLFIIISIIALIILFKWKYEKEYLIAYSLITAGIIGNLIDRILFSYVRDFIDFMIWPVFNIADMSIVIGVFIFVIILLRK